MQPLRLPILVGDVPGSPLVAMPPTEALDDVPAPLRARNADSLPQAQISAWFAAVTETHLHQSYVVRKGWGAQFAHRGFPALFSMEKGKRWRKLLEEHTFKVLPKDLRMAAREAYEYSATSKLMRIVPQNVPPYLEKLKGAAEEDW
jgi:hypothetical protein